jgi:hypothetical protein
MASTGKYGGPGALQSGTILVFTVERSRAIKKFQGPVGDGHFLGESFEIFVRYGQMVIAGGPSVRSENGLAGC